MWFCIFINAGYIKSFTILFKMVHAKLLMASFPIIILAVVAMGLVQAGQVEDCALRCHSKWFICIGLSEGFSQSLRCNSNRETCFAGCTHKAKRRPAQSRTFTSATQKGHPRRPKKLKLTRKLRILLKSLEKQLRL